MLLFLHLSIHLLFALLAGFIGWQLWRKPLVALAAGLLGSVFIDLDHLIDYFIAFGWHFNLSFFLHGYQFSKNDNIYIIFHAWEYVVLFVLIGLIYRKRRSVKTFYITLALGIFFHLTVDVLLNDMMIKSYSLIYRWQSNFLMEKIIKSEYYSLHQAKKQLINSELK